MSVDRSYVGKDSDGEYVESLVYYDHANWKDDVVDKANGTIRIMTYNVHAFYDRKFVRSLDEILEIIRRVDPDVLVVEEFVLYRTKNQITFPQFKKFLKGLGFTVITTDRLRNNVLASKYTGELSPTLELGKDAHHRVSRFANIIRIDAKTIGSDKDLIVVGTHLDVYDESGQTRHRQAGIIIDALENIRARQMVGGDSTYDPIVIVTGDFNCLRPEDYDEEEWAHICKVDDERGVDSYRMRAKTDRKVDAIQRFEETGLIDASVMLGTPIRASVWANRRVDYICGRNVQFDRVHTVRNASSDHYPVYADFHS